ncbi:MAG TPA: hypothetical protein VEQ10_12645 [Vicinamibacteria bacterium]|nr:hypothetical protein [Vicinamibacteria bacterium]
MLLTVLLAALPATIAFDASLPAGEKRLALADIASDFPRDWSKHEALVLELRASSPQRIQLRIHLRDSVAGKNRVSRVVFQPWPGVWLRAALPVSLLAQPPSTGDDMAAVGNRSQVGYYLGLWGPFVPLTDVESIGFEMEHPVGSPTLELRNVRLERTSPGDAILDGLPLVDALGQYAHGAWPGKAASVEELRRDWQAEEKALGPADAGLCRYGGYLDLKAAPSGFFRLERRDHRWWFIDPDGHLFLSLGVDVVQPWMATRLAGREAFFAERPPEALQPAREDGERDPGLSFLTWNLLRRFGGDWKHGFTDLVFRRMVAWGLNTVGNWSDEALFQAKRRPYVVPLESWLTEVSYLGLPDVYSEAFEQQADERAARQCEPRREDPWLLGYFLANEPPFPQKELQTVDLILSGPATPTQAALLRWLAEGDSEKRRKEFVAEAFSRYIEVTSAAVRRHDPNHLNLGMRSGGRPTPAEIRAARAFDVYSVNIYDYEVTPGRVKEISGLTGKPILIGEFHFGTPGRGLAASLVQVRDQKERGRAYRYYVENAFAMPEVIGTHWFQWADQPSTGRFDGENYDIGLVDVTDRPYPDLVSALQETHRRVRGLHTGELLPTRERPVAN